MSTPDQRTIQNQLLAGLAPADFAVLKPHLKRVDMALRTQIVVPGQQITHTWFPESGIISVVTSMPDGRQVEAGIVGREGMVDFGTVNGVDRSPIQCFVQVAGEAWRLPVADLRRAMDESPGLRARLALFVQAFYVQVAHTAFANAANTIEQRLARWLLMASDRASPDEAIAMTHEFMSIMLGVRRAGVTIAVQALAEMGAVKAGRGSVKVIDRARLEAASHGVYGPPEAEYRRLLGVVHRGNGVAMAD